MDIFIQTLGIFGMLMAIISYQCKTNRNYFIFQGLCGFFFSVQFLLTGAWAGLMFNVLNMVRAVIYQRQKNKPLWSLFSLEIATLAIVLISFFAFKEAWWLVLFVLIAQACGTYSMWTKNGKLIRIVQFLLVSPFWLLYDALIPTPSIGGVLCECFNIASVIVSFIRFRKMGFDKT